MDEYLDVKIDIFEHTDQRARLRRSLTINGLIEEILKEFDDISRDSFDKYAVYLNGSNQPLNRSSTIVELDLQPQDELIFEYKHQTIRENFLPQQYVYLVDPVSGKTFDIQWQPAVIGRPTAEAEHNLLLAVNVQFIQNGMTISRRHAQIILIDDKYYVESLTENNPLYVNDIEVPFNSKAEVVDGSKIAFGNHKVILIFRTQQTGRAVSREARPQAAVPPVSAVIPPKVQSAPIPEPQPSQKVDLTMDASADQSSIIPSHLIIEEATAKEQVGQRIEITSYPFVIGRTLPCLCAENGVSRRHAEIGFDPQTKVFTITDLKSTNGIFIEGAELDISKAYEIKPGMRFSLGNDVVLKFEI